MANPIPGLTQPTFLETAGNIPKWIVLFFKEHLGKVSSHTLGWLTIVLCHFAAIPTLLAVLTGHSDKLPPVDLMLFIWSALVTLFFKSLIEKNFLYIATIALGFVAQTLLSGLILYK